MGGFGDFRHMITPPLVPDIPFDSGSIIFSLQLLALNIEHRRRKEYPGLSVWWRCRSDGIVVLEVDVTGQQVPHDNFNDDGGAVSSTIHGPCVCVFVDPPINMRELNIL